MKNEILTDISLHQGFMHLREIIINNVKRENRRSSESKAMLASALPSRDGGRLYVKRMADSFAFGEFWRRFSPLDRFNTCQWHSACSKFGHSNNMTTLSLSGTRLPYSSLYLINKRGRLRANIRLCLRRSCSRSADCKQVCGLLSLTRSFSWRNAKGGRCVFPNLTR